MNADWQDLLSLDSLEPRDVTEVRLGRLHLAIHDTESGLYATDARCTHAGANLCDGYLDRHLIECPLHQGCFDVRTGEAKGAPCHRPLRTWPLRIQGDRLQIRLTSGQEDSGRS